jgi:hypothetical protein
MPITTIDQVVQALDEIIADCRLRRSRLGFFAALYRQVTIEIRTRIADGFFEDGARITQLDVLFAKRYLDAYAARGAGKPTAEAWRVAFDTGLTGRVTILQDLVLGTNAHINLDLAVATATANPGSSINSMQSDFDRINTILSDLIDAAQEVVDDFSPGMNLLDAVGGRSDEEFVTFSLLIARQEAWLNAEVLASRGPQQWPPYVRSMDRRASLVGRHLAEPGFPFDLALRSVRLLESRDVPAIIDALTTLTAA